MKLVLPQDKYKTGFSKALEELPEKERWRLLSIKSQVPQSVFWFVDKNEFIGRVKVRHKLNKKLLRKAGHISYVIAKSKRNKGYGTQALRLALKKAKKLGLKKVLLTCKENNMASKKIIEKNGGKFRNAIYAKPKNDYKTLRYWIDLS